MPQDPEVEPLPPQVWYVSYGSNMASRRLAAYLEGGVPAGGSRANPGARNRALPSRSIAVDLPGTLYFAGDSRQWGGGVAFYDHDARDPERGAPTAARAYLVTAGQFADIAAQEMYRAPDEDHPLEELVVSGIDGRHRVGPGRYETLVEVGRVDGLPMLLFTAPHGLDHDDHDHDDHAEPSPAYVAMLAEGLRESRDWTEQEVSAYLERVGVPRTSLEHVLGRR